MTDVAKVLRSIADKMDKGEIVPHRFNLSKELKDVPDYGNRLVREYSGFSTITLQVYRDKENRVKPMWEG